MEAGSQPPGENAPATKDRPILLSPDPKSDVEMAEPAPAAPAANPPKPSSSSSPPAGPPAPHPVEPAKPAPSSAAPILSNGNSAPSPNAGSGGGVSPAEDKKRATQAPAPNAAAPQPARRLPNAAVPHHPQAVQTPQHPSVNAPTSGVHAQPTLSQQGSPDPATSLASVPAAQQREPSALMAAAPAPSPASHAPRASNHVPHWAPSDQSRPTASPAPPQLSPFQEPHNPSSVDPYTVDNVFTRGFYLPDTSDGELSPETYVEQCNRLYAVVRTMHPSVVRRIMRDTWKTSLVGSEAHISFLLTVVMHKCSGSSARTAISKFGKDFVKDAKWQIMSHFDPALLAEVEDTVVDKAPDSLLDKAMAKRLSTIPARSLLNMLARAERLGYEESDIIDEDPRASKPAAQPTAPTGHGVPNNYTSMPAGPHDPQSQPSLQPQAQQQLQNAVSDSLVCPLCHKRYPSQTTRDFHLKKKVCQKPPVSVTYVCHQCDQSFSASAGLDYHKRYKVCGDNDGKAPAGAAPSPSSVASSAGNSPASYAPVQLPPPPPPSSAQPQAQRANPVPPTSTPSRPLGQTTPYMTGAPPPAGATPVQPHHPTQATPQAKSAAPPGSQASPYDPYAHLTPEKYKMMENELLDAENRYGIRMDEVRRTVTDPALCAKKLDSLKNSFATKQSMIRKKYGVRLRERRSRAAIEEQRRRMGMSSPQGSQPFKAWTPTAPADAHASKKARAMDGQAVPTHSAAQETPTRKHAASADVAAPLSGGLAASAAAPETVDPTRSGEVSRPPAHNGGGYRADPHPASSQGVPAQSTPAKPPSNSPVKSMLQQPVIEVGDDTDTDSDSDEDTIPAQLPPPPPRPSQGLGRAAR